MHSRLEGWKGKFLSIAGRITLVKAVLNNLPVYYMSLFAMPVSVVNLINKIIGRFIWGSEKGRGIHWVKWENLCKPKRCGGLGLVDIKVKNQSLLNKWLWRYGNEPDSLWRKVIDAKNEKVFDNKSLTEEQVFEIAILRIGWWLKCKWPCAITSISEFLAHPELCSTKFVKKARPLPGSWVAPPRGQLKFNVDASTRGSFGEAGIGGILRDNRGAILIKFSKFLNPQVGVFKSGPKSGPLSAELEAILEACRIFSNEKWLHSHRLVIESDSVLALSWIVGNKPCPAFLAEKVSLCRQFRDRFNWEFIFAFRETNCDAHVLATHGVQRFAQLLWIAEHKAGKVE
ncbi:hypothetical protein GQ457_12G026210 [Hibiscus cannabinus]